MIYERVILADDLTGACDAAAPFAAGGRSVTVFLDRPLHPAGGVVAIDLDLRERARDETYEVAFRAGRQWRGERLFAKIDSTLRGHVAAFVSGILDGAGMETAIVCPAFPRNGRSVEKGVLHVAGSAEAGPDLRSVLAGRGHALAHVGRGPGAARLLEQAMADDGSGSKRMVIADAASEADLAIIASAVERSGEKILVAGSGGLAEAFAAGRDERKSGFSPPHSAGPVLVLSGSPAQATLDQIRCLTENSGATVFDADAGAVDIDPTQKVLVLATAGTEPLQRDNGCSSRHLARRVRRIANEMKPAAAIMIGGRSMRAMCIELGVDAMDMKGQLCGLPHGHLRGGAWNGVPVVTKPGGFGGREILRQLVERMTEQGQRR